MNQSDGMTQAIIFDATDTRQVREMYRNLGEAVTRAGRLKKRVRVEVSEYKAKRSDRQNRYYWPCFVQPFADWMREEWGDDNIDEDAAHEYLKHRFLTRQIVSPSGKRVSITRSTTSLTVTEFNFYLDTVGVFLAEWCGILVPPAGVYREPVRRRREKAPA